MMKHASVFPDRHAALFRDFHSLGSNAEFGVVQNHFAPSAAGLLQWAHVQGGFEALIHAIEDGFGRIGEALELVDIPNGVVSRDETYGIVFHVSDDTERALLLESERRRLPILAGGLLDAFQSPDAILVYKAEADLATADLLRLRQAIDRHGGAPILWVVEAASPDRVGRVELIAPGLLRGEIDRFAPRENVFEGCSLPIWLLIAERARALADAIARAAPRGDDVVLRHALRSDHGTILVRRDADGELRHGDGGTPGTTQVVLLRLPAWPDVGFLVATGPAGTPLLLHPGQDRAPVLAVRIGVVGEGVALRHPTSFRFYCSTPIETDGTGGMIADRTALSAWEIFEPMPPQSASLPEDLTDAIDALLPVFRARFAAGPVIEWAGQAPDAHVRLLGGAVVSLCPPDTLASLGARMRRDGAFAARLVPIGGSAIEDALRFQPGTVPPERIDVGPEADFYASSVQLTERESNAGLALLAACRRQVEPSRGTCLLATARNEGPYLVDWIAHHRALGLEHVFLYSNDNDDGSDALLAALAASGAITWLPNRSSPGIDRQCKAYNHAFQAVPALLDFRWVAIIDLDEFLVVDESAGPSLDRLLALLEADGAEEVVANWRMFTPSAETVFADRPITSRFRRRLAATNVHVKTIVRSNRAVGSSAHIPIWASRTGRKTVDGAGRPYRFPHAFTGPEAWQAPHPAPLWINHYHLKSLPEYVWKVSRNNGTEPFRPALHFTARFLDTFLSDFDDPHAVADEGALALADAVAIERERLMVLPGVRAAHAATVDVFARRISSLVRDLDAAPLDFGSPDQRARFATLLRDSVSRGVVVP